MESNPSSGRRAARAERRRPGPDIEIESPREEYAPARAARSRTSRRRGRPAVPLLPLLLVVLLVGGGAAAISLMRPADAAPRREAVSSIWQPVTSQTVEATTAAPTPYFASFRGAKLRLPVPATAVTALAFHQSSYPDTYKVTSLVPFETASAAKAAATTAKAHGTKVLATPADGPEADASGVWTGTALELWRTARAGQRCSAMDCGAHWDTTVFSPLDGTVMRIRAYKLYGKYDDIEIQIKPDAWNDVDVFILHVTDAAVFEGQHVTAGVTPVAKVRHLSGVVSGLQLRSYTTDGGNHTHVQFNVVPKPDQQWVVGQDAPGLVRHGN